MGSPRLAPQAVTVFLEIENAARGLHTSFQVQRLHVKLAAASNGAHETAKRLERLEAEGGNCM